MKSTNISIRDLIDALAGKRNLNKPVGYARNVYGQFLVAFIATYPETHEVEGVTMPHPSAGKPVWTEDEERVKLNWRISNRQNG